ncbi:MAG: hypothetical protein CSA39_06530 [Flavobacteriales bacterium]|nr:MAG: hypothetical protein CR985_00050 [Flavobacteriales bacterium]PIE48674.1 MAG: hypothetical protein CSA39_06530 [Flavobacteriales bacterium]
MLRRFLLLPALFILIFPAHAGFSTTTPSYDILKITGHHSHKVVFASYAEHFYSKINDNSLNYEAFSHALKGYVQLKENGRLENKKYLTVIDMQASVNEERFFIINMETQTIEHKSVVAHGKNSGLEYAKRFSNRVNSHQSSIGFYKTAETYIGKHGFSMRLDGLERSNSNARKRAIVIHQADYMEQHFMDQNGRMGRSFGCPSLPAKDYKIIIEKIKEGSCLFIYFPKEHYLKTSKFIQFEYLLSKNA